MSTVENLRASDATCQLFCDFDDARISVELGAPGSGGLLAGRLIGLKANIACKDAVWSAGLAHRAQLRAGKDAHVTTLLRAAGARVLPGLNMDAAALGGTTENAHFGATRNPVAPDHSAGGSSGGSAAAVASGAVTLALGTDTLGSIRIPASWCGVFGLKPTFGAVGRRGILPLAPGLDCVGPLSADAAGLLDVMRALAGDDAEDAGSRAAPAGWLTGDLEDGIDGLRIGVLADDPVDCAPEVRGAVAQLAQVLQAAGATIVSVTMDDWNPAALRQAAFLQTEWEGAEVFADQLAEGDVLPKPVQKMLSFGHRASAEKRATAMAEMARARVQMAQTFQQVDVLLTPTTPQRAIRLGTPPPANQADYTALANVAGVPALAAPLSVGADPLKASAQFIGPAWSEMLLIRLARMTESADVSTDP